jgi:hypothetical protein
VAERHDVHMLQPLGHNPTGNSAVAARMASSGTYPGGQLEDSRIPVHVYGRNVQQKQATGFLPYEVMFGTPVVTQALNARGVMGPRAREPTPAVRRELTECLQASAAAEVSTAAARGNTARWSTAVALNRQGRVVLEDLVPAKM